MQLWVPSHWSHTGHYSSATPSEQAEVTMLYLYHKIKCNLLALRILALTSLPLSKFNKRGLSSHGEGVRR